MANEILYAGIADLRTAEALVAEYLYLLADRNALPNHPALVYIGDSYGSPSLVRKISQLGLMGYDLLQPVGDGALVGNTALTDASATVTIGRYSKSYERSDMARMSDANGVLDATMFAMDAVAAAATTLLSLVANVIDDFTANVSTSGVNLTFASFLAAIGVLEVANVQPPYMCQLHGQQMADLKSDLSTATAGAIQWMPATHRQIELLGTGYRGELAGVDLFSTNHQPTANAGADRAGGIWGRGAVAWGDSSFPNENGADQLLIGGDVLLERDRTAKAGTTSWVTHRMLGVSIALDAAGCSIISDA